MWTRTSNANPPRPTGTPPRREFLGLAFFKSNVKGIPLLGGVPQAGWVRVRRTLQAVLKDF